MDFLWDKITEWLKEMLIGGIVSNLSGMFDATNQKVAEISGQVGLSPQAWNGSIFSMIQNLSETVIVPIAGAILAFVMTLELIQLIADRNNLHDIDTWVFFKWVFKTATAVLIVPLLALTVPITDTLLAIVRRKSSGVPIFSPDKNHLHHRLLAKGLNQKQVVLVMYALTAFFSCTALIVIHLSLWIGIAIVAIALVLFVLWARKLGVMQEIVPSPYQMEQKKKKDSD